MSGDNSLSLGTPVRVDPVDTEITEERSEKLLRKNEIERRNSLEVFVNKGDEFSEKVSKEIRDVCLDKTAKLSTNKDSEDIYHDSTNEDQSPKASETAEIDKNSIDNGLECSSPLNSIDPISGSESSSDEITFKVHNDTKSSKSEEVSSEKNNCERSVSCSPAESLKSLVLSSEADSVQYLNLSSEIDSPKFVNISNDVNSNGETVENKKYDYDFDNLLESVDGVSRGMKIAAAAKKYKVPYHRLYVFLHELHFEWNKDEKEKDTPVQKVLTFSSTLNTENQSMLSGSIGSKSANEHSEDNYVKTIAMKSEISKANMAPLTETRSPMINIPASIIKEFIKDKSDSADNANTILTSNLLPGSILRVNEGTDGTKASEDTSRHILNGCNVSIHGEKNQITSTMQKKVASTVKTVPTASENPAGKLDSSIFVANNVLVFLSHQTVDMLGNGECLDLPNIEESLTATRNSSEPSSPTAVASSENGCDSTKSSATGVTASNEDSNPSSGLDSLLTFAPANPMAVPVSPVDDYTPTAEVTELAPMAPCQSPAVNNSMDDDSVSSTDLSNTSTSNLLNKVEPKNGFISSSNDNVSEKRRLKRDHDDTFMSAKKFKNADSRNSSLSNGVNLTENYSENDLLNAVNKQELLNDEIEKLQNRVSKIHRMKRVELEDLILDLFSTTLLNSHELGRQRKLCEKLESTLESNRKKAAQFHKELDDMKKVTKRLQEEHLLRKDQLVTPIKVKRSVGIQVAPHIIQKGLSKVHTAQAVITPSVNITKGFTSNSSLADEGVDNTNGNSSPSQFADNNAGFTSAYEQNHKLYRNSPSSDRRISPLPQSLQQSSAIHSNQSSSMANNNVIDLTDEDEGRGTSKPAVPVTPSAQIHSQAPLQHLSQQQTAALLKMPQANPGFVSLPVQAGSGTTQYVLVPSSATTPPTLVVVSNSSTASMTSANKLLVGAVAKPMTASIPVTANPSLLASTLTHPAPLPKTAPQQVLGGIKPLPPQPRLGLSHKANSIVLNWTMSKTSDHEPIASYQIYAYQEGSQPPSSTLWKKVGSVKALELPMACTLTQFMPGHRYHFAVRAVDARSRLGPFSDPRSIRLEK